MKKIEKIAAIILIMLISNNVIHAQNNNAKNDTVNIQNTSKNTDSLANFDYKAQGITEEQWNSITKKEQKAFAESVGYTSIVVANIKKENAELDKKNAELNKKITEQCLINIDLDCKFLQDGGKITNKDKLSIIERIAMVSLREHLL